MRSPFWFWLSGWLTLSVLALYGAEDLHELLVATPWLGEKAWVLRASEQTLALAESTGLAALHDGVERLRRDPLAAKGDAVAREPVAAPGHSLPVSSAEATPADAPPRAEPRPARRVLLLGASSMQFALGVELERLLSQRQGLVVERHGKASTGLVRSDRIDWPARAEAWIAGFEPDLVITNFGGNDAQGLTLPGATPRERSVAPFASAAWDLAYGERVARIAESARRHGSRVVMLGMPIMRQAGFSERIAHVNAVTKATVEAHGGVYLSTWELASDEQGHYRKSIAWAGKTGPMRAPDGHHYTPLGGSYVAAQIADELERRGLLPPATKR